MSEPEEHSGGSEPWLGEGAPCVYCGRVIPRDSRRCPHCRTSFSLAVRRASREVIGEWFYLDPQNPSGRGVTFETIVKMVEKGRIRRDSIVRGPTTHQDWMYAAETPRLAKYLGMCPHCFVEAKPEDTYCTSCQLNMNQKPPDARPGVPPELVKEPHHRAAHEMEEKLAAAPAEAPPAKALAAAEPVGREGGVAAATAFAEGPTPAPARQPHIGLRTGRRRPKLWVVLVLTWITLTPLVLFLFFAPPEWKKAFVEWRDATFGTAGAPDGAGPNGLGPTAPDGSASWVNEQLNRADEEVAAGRKATGQAAAEHYAGAIAIYQNLIDKTGDTTWEARIHDLRRKIQEERRRRLDGLRERLELAGQMAKQHRYDDSLAILRNIGSEDRDMLASINVSVQKMEADIKAAAQRWREERQKQEEELAGELERAKRLRDEGRPADALAVYDRVASAFPADLVAEHIKIDEVRAALKARIEAAPSEPPPDEPPPSEPPPDEAPKMTEEQIKAAVAGLLEEAEALEKEEGFAEALEKLEAIEKFDEKYWPESLEEDIKRVKRLEETAEFFGL